MAPDNSKQSLAPKDLLTHSVKLLNNYLSIYKQGGLVVTGKEKVTLAGVLAEGSYDVKNLVRMEQLDTIAAFYLMALKELWSNTSNTFTNESITSCSLLLINRYGDWHPKELIIVLRNGLVGAYGKTFGKVNTDEVMRWAKEYDEVERVKHFENKDKNGSHEIGWNEMDAGMLKEIFKPEDKKANAKTLNIYIPRQRTEQEELIQIWMKEFDGIYKAQNIGKIDDNPIKFIKIKESKNETIHLSIEEYLLYRMENNQNPS
jgi:hypothetical protein